MKERPILFNGPMVRALLDGSKTQTRRVMKRQPPAVIQDGYLPKVYWPARDKHMSSRGDRAYLQFEQPGEYDGRHIMKDGYGFECPHGQPGDRLWVRETFLYVGPGSGSDLPRYREERANPENHKASNCWFRATQPDEKLIWTPSIHMPRWASRITLEVTGVRVERLNDISENDAHSEGCAAAWLDVDGEHVNAYGAPTYVQGFARLWRDINGAESWDMNPWVWVVEFKRVTQ